MATQKEDGQASVVVFAIGAILLIGGAARLFGADGAAMAFGAILMGVILWYRIELCTGWWKPDPEDVKAEPK